MPTHSHPSSTRVAGFAGFTVAAPPSLVESGLTGAKMTASRRRPSRAGDRQNSSADRPRLAAARPSAAGCYSGGVAAMPRRGPASRVAGSDLASSALARALRRFAAHARRELRDRSRAAQRRWHRRATGPSRARSAHVERQPKLSLPLRGLDSRGLRPPHGLQPGGDRASPCLPSIPGLRPSMTGYACHSPLGGWRT